MLVLYENVKPLSQCSVFNCLTHHRQSKQSTCITQHAQQGVKQCFYSLKIDVYKWSLHMGIVKFILEISPASVWIFNQVVSVTHHTVLSYFHLEKLHFK